MEDDRAAWEAFVGALGATLSPEHAGTFATILRAAERARPGLVVDPSGFAQLLGARLVGFPDPIAELGTLHVADLLLAFAIEHDASGAAEAFDEVLRPVAARVHGSVGTGRSFDELLQELRVHFLVDRVDRPARIREFRGRSSLGRWLLVAATRAALNMVRDRPRELAFEDAFFLAQPDLRTPEAQLLDATYGSAMRSAVGRALACLAERERALLWFSLVDGRPAEQIGKIYGVHRTTAARWIERAIANLRKALESELAASDGLAASQLSSIVRTILSEK